MRIISVILFFSLVSSAHSQINQEWVNMDTALIKSVKEIIKQSPEEVGKFFLDTKYRNRKIDLGFGWATYLLPVAKGGGYISVYANLYYYHDTIRTYILKCYVPNDSLLWREYINLYWEFLTPDSNVVFYYKFNEEPILQPVKDFKFTYDSSVITKQLSEYMSPSSGTVYGDRGGISNSILQNRKLFNELKDTLTRDQLILLMHAVNPASRLTAIEYYIRHKKRFGNNKDVDAWIEKVYVQAPLVETMSGCLRYEDKSKDIVLRFVRMKHDPK